MLTIISDNTHFRAIVSPSDNGSTAVFYERLNRGADIFKPIGIPLEIALPFHRALDIATDLINQMQLDIPCHK